VVICQVYDTLIVVEEEREENNTTMRGKKKKIFVDAYGVRGSTAGTLTTSDVAKNQNSYSKKKKRRRSN